MSAPGNMLAKRASVIESLSDAQFHQIAALAHGEFGLSLPETKKALVYARLSKRLRALGLRNFGAYCALLQTPGSQEKTNLLSALTTNVTQFFREQHHFELLRKTVLPKMLPLARPGRPLRIWSAGCSSGQEPYSIAMTLQQMRPTITAQEVQICATDIDPKILSVAREGEYDLELTTAVPQDLRAICFENGSDKSLRVAPRTRALVSFDRLNLIEDWSFAEPFDIIFCRNVTIYFDNETKNRLWRRFTQHLRAGGALFIGHSERLGPDTAATYNTIGVTAFEKKDGAQSGQRGAT